MDKKQAIDLLDNLIGMIEDNQENDYDEALKMGIKALAIPSAESMYCDRNICLRNEYNGISCDECEVGNPCLYCKHNFEPQESEEV